ncbi:class I lanthipeptide [Taibaiella chishuiensis]|uniref:Uncharacterized protein n=1 Tax=Taibaiella chishuiensis TaxID=1434707 RepID=A0A2P8D629_9BACT|nr:hypothetical protein B0I18_103244 [Taibaiella chishuiensis]
MKKKKLNLDAKLFLDKSVVSALNGVNPDAVLGGNTAVSICMQCPYTRVNLTCVGCDTRQPTICPTIMQDDRCCVIASRMSDCIC